MVHLTKEHFVRKVQEVGSAANGLESILEVFFCRTRGQGRFRYYRKCKATFVRARK